MDNNLDIPDNKESDFPKKYPIGPDPLSEEKLDRILKEELTDWKIIFSSLPEDPTSKRAELYREYLFEDFDKVIEYMTRVAEVCNILPHHPRWVNTWTTLRVYLTTWDIKHIISYKDIMLARNMDRIYGDYAKHADNLHTKGRTEKEKEEFKRKQRELLRKDELETVFANLNSYTVLNPEQNKEDELIVISNRFNRIGKDKRAGTSSPEVISREMNIIISDLLSFINSL